MYLKVLAVLAVQCRLQLFYVDFECSPFRQLLQFASTGLLETVFLGCVSEWLVDLTHFPNRGW